MIVKRYLWTIIFFIFLIFYISSCKDSTSPTNAHEVNELNISPGKIDITAIQDTINLPEYFTVTDGEGNDVDTNEFDWEIGNTLYAKITDDDELVGTSKGTTTLGIIYKGFSEQITININSRISSLSISPDTTVTWVDESKTVFANLIDIDGNEILNADLDWSVEDANKLEILDETDSSATIKTLREGYVNVILKVEGEIATGTIQVNSTLHGTVTSIDQNNFENVRFYLKTDTSEYSAKVRRDGNFELRLNFPAEGKKADQYFDTPNEFKKRYHPSLKKDSLIQSDDKFNAVLVPKNYTIPNGKYAGLELPISLQLAFAVPNFQTFGNFYSEFLTNYSFKYILEDVSSDNNKRANSVSWPLEKFPIPVYFDRENSNIEISKNDSIKFWDNLNDMEYRFGKDLYRPAFKNNLEEYIVERRFGIDPTSIRLYSISVSVDSTIRANGLGGAFPACLNSNDGICAEGLPKDDFISGSATFQEKRYLHDDFFGYVGQHEMVHALGFSHACFPSVNTSCHSDRFSPYPYQNLPVVNPDDIYATEYDVAYMSVYWQIHEKVMDTSADFGLMESLIGERIRDLDLGEIPQCYLDGSSCNTNGKVPSTDIIVN